MTYQDEKGKYIFPSGGYDAGNFTILCVNTAVIPFFRIFFAEMQERWRWSTREDWWRAYQTFAEMEEGLMAGCVDALIAEQQRLYRLLDNALNGTNYTATTDAGVTTIEPAIPDVPTNPAGVSLGLRHLAGELPGGWFGIGARPANLADVVQALRVGSSSRGSSLLDTLGAILAAAGNTAEVFSLVEQLLSDTVNASQEGAIVAVLIASTMAQTAQLGGTLDKLNRLIEQIGVGAEPLPAETVAGRLETIGLELAP